MRLGVAFAPPPRVGFYVLESRAEPVTPAAASELHKNCVMLVVDDRIGASAGCAEVDGEVREWLREAAEAEVPAAAFRVHWAMCLAYDAACLPFGMVGELRRKLSPIALAVLLLFMGVGIMNIRVSAEFPCSRQRAAFSPIIVFRSDSLLSLERPGGHQVGVSAGTRGVSAGTVDYARTSQGAPHCSDHWACTLLSG